MALSKIKKQVSAGTTHITFGKPDTSAVAWSSLGTGYLGVGGSYPDFG